MSTRRLRKKCLNPTVLDEDLKGRSSSNSDVSDDANVELHNVQSERKLRKKKMRCTEELNCFNKSLNTENFDNAVQKKSKKSKKTKFTYELPNISCVAEGLNRKKDHLKEAHGTTETTQRKTSRKKPVETHEGVAEDEKIVANEHNFEVDDNNQNSEEYNTVHSVINDCQSYSDVEIDITNKTQKMKRKNKIDKSCIQNEDDSYTKRIKMLLADSPNKYKKHDTDASLASSKEKPKRKSSIMKNINKMNVSKKCLVSIKEDDKVNGADKSTSLNLVMAESMTADENINSNNTFEVKFPKETECLSINDDMCRIPLDKSIDPEYTMANIKNQEHHLNTSKKCLSFNTARLTRNFVYRLSPSKQRETSVKRTSVQNFHKNVSTPGKIKRSTKSLLDVSETECETFDAKVRESSDVLRISSQQTNFEELEKSRKQNETKTLEKSECKSTKDKYDVKKARKSVRFESPKEKMDETTSDECINLDSTFEVNSPKTSKDVLLLNASLNEDLVDNPFKNYIPTPAKSKKSKEKASLKLLSSKNIRDENSEDKNKFFVSSKKLCGEGTFSICDETIDDTTTSKKSYQTEESSKLHNATPFEVANATSTCARHDTPLQSMTDFDISIDKTIDSSKVTKRRRWDKLSRVSVSFLDGSLDIGNTSVPWENKTSSGSFSTSHGNIAEKKVVEASEAKPEDFEPFSKWHGASPSVTSTPLPHKTLLTGRNKSMQDSASKLNQTANKGSESLSRKLMRKKVPNFALIHQKAYDKLESLQEMSERKAARAKWLLSGHKPLDNGNAQKSTKKKALQFGPSQSTNKSNVSVTKIKTISPSKSNQKVPNKENIPIAVAKRKELLKVKSQIPKRVPHNAVVAERNGFTRFGFKIVPGGPDKKDMKKEVITAVATKTKPPKNMIQDRRAAIRGVRSNRRFELLMQMRNK